MYQNQVFPVRLTESQQHAARVCLGMWGRERQTDRTIFECFEPEHIRDISNFIQRMADSPDLCNGFSTKSIIASESFTNINAKKFVRYL